MNIITLKVRLVDAPVPPFVGTRLDIHAEGDLMTFGISSAKLATGHETVTVDCGDGTVETLSAVSKFTHTYAAPGDYAVRISDDLSSLTVCTSTAGSPFRDIYPQLIRRVVSTAQNLTMTGFSCFYNCTNLTGVDMSEAATTSLPHNAFASCPLLVTCRLPNGLTTLGSQCFEECSKIAPIDVPMGVRQLSTLVFKDCTSLLGEINLPSITTIQGGLSAGPFQNCTGITTFHFAAENEEAVRNSAGYKADPTLGTGSAICVFDL